MTSDVYVHARHKDGGMDLVGRYRLVTPAAGHSYGEFAYVGSWLKNGHGRAFALDPEHLPLQQGPFRSPAAVDVRASWRTPRILPRGTGGGRALARHA